MYSTSWKQQIDLSLGEFETPGQECLETMFTCLRTRPTPIIPIKLNLNCHSHLFDLTIRGCSNGYWWWVLSLPVHTNSTHFITEAILLVWDCRVWGHYAKWWRQSVQHVKRLKGAYITYDRRALTFIAHLSKMGGLDGESATSTVPPPTWFALGWSSKHFCERNLIHKSR